MTGAIALLAPWFAALLPPARELPSAFAERTLFLPRSSNARPGPLRLTRAQKQIVDAAAEPGVREIVLMTATQCGKTTSLEALLAWAIAGEAGPMLLVRPDDGDAKAFVRENLDPLIDASPALRRLIGAGPNGVDSVDLKSFPGGSLAIASSWKAMALAGRSIRVLVCDEVERFALIVSGGEGEPTTIAKRRLQLYDHNSLTILASSPTLKATSRIAKHHARGDQRTLNVTCTACGQADDITQDRLAFEPGRPETARLLCLCCGHRATEAERLAMLDNGEFRPTAIGEPGVVSFHMSELASEFSTLETVARAVDAAKTLEAKKVLTNTTFGLPWESEAEAEVDPAYLESRAVEMREPFDAAIDYVTAGVDVQADRIEATILATSKVQASVLDHVVLRGDTSGTKVWNDLNIVMSRTFKTTDGRTLPISTLFVDGGFQTQVVADYVTTQPAKGRKAWVIFGRQGFDRAALKPGQRVRSVARSYILGVDNLKLAVVKALAGSDGVKPILLPAHLDAAYFAQLTSERLETRYVRGYAKYAWAKERHVRNEALDCLVYAVAASMTMTARVDPKASKSTTNSRAMLDAMLRLNDPKKERTDAGNQS